MGMITIGADIGQKRDPTAVAVSEESVRVVGGKLETYHGIRRLERLPLGTSYPDVATRLAEIVANTRKRRGLVRMVYVDATGVGQPVVDTLAAANLGVPLMAVYFTHGDRRLEQDGPPRYVSLGKTWLVSRLQVLLQTGRILLPKTAEAEALAKELMDYEIRVTEQANDTYGAFKVGAHDDLVTALGLATQLDPPPPTGAPWAGGPRNALTDPRPRRYDGGDDLRGRGDVIR